MTQHAKVAGLIGFCLLITTVMLLTATPVQAIVPEHEVRDGGVYLKGVGPDSPIIYDNDWWFDVFDNNYLWAQVSLGRANLRGNIVSRDMWRLIKDNLGQANQLGDGAPLVWLFNPKCWTGVELQRAEYKGKAVEFSPVPSRDPGDLLVIPRAKTDLIQCHDEFFRVLRDPSLFLKPKVIP